MTTWHSALLGIRTSGDYFISTFLFGVMFGIAATAIGTHPDLTVHVIGLGNEVHDAELQAIAEAGGGRYHKNPSSSEIGSVFDLVTREFATIQTHGATIPLPPADYTFRLTVNPDGHGSGDEYTFTFRAGDEGAGLLE